ncbi:hypothetical protein D3C72_2365140 [compost metagenome]
MHVASAQLVAFACKHACLASHGFDLAASTEPFAFAADHDHAHDRIKISVFQNLSEGIHHL